MKHRGYKHLHHQGRLLSNQYTFTIRYVQPILQPDNFKNPFNSALYNIHFDFNLYTQVKSDQYFHKKEINSDKGWIFEDIVTQKRFGLNWSNNQRLFEKAQNEDYTLLMSDDMSWHYYMASIADEDHFGNPDKIKLSNLASILFGIFVNPFLVYMSIYTITGQWMWQFDGKNHTAYEDRNNMNFEEDINKRPTTTWWFLLKHNN